MSEEEQKDSDVSIILSSEVISEVMEKYFNDEMFKKVVKVVNFKASDDGVMFSLDFVTDNTQSIQPRANIQSVIEEERQRLQKMHATFAQSIAKADRKAPKRSKKGTFVAVDSDDNNSERQL